ncbi:MULTISPECIES: VapE domain-containing protein [unclassified Pseudomonas]|uniref:VapE domain-containing protein n=1 Tax=unclassified Pseudomonas TaxID=196821 RepID=UPI00244A5508|nr:MULTISPECIES: VapE domain-containing protein [unclassified Pseudomonas]MDG9925450.1 toprim domain-containing protein [Pseudomonas sp. GD04045]MDH0034109.1 toprim domain-containing protein [Pseudomonas sp. GD04019]
MSDSHSLIDDVLDQLRDGGLDPDLPLLTNGTRVRCRDSHDKGNSRTGFYRIYEHVNEGRTFYAGAFGSWREGEKGSFHKLKPVGGRMSAEDKKVIAARVEAAKQREASLRAARVAKAARRAAGMWKALPTKGRCGYLDRKQIGAFGLRFGRKPDTALVPLVNVRDEVVGLQVLFGTPDKDGLSKRYWPAGLDPVGAFHLIGPRPEPGEAVLICEGYATGASLHMATGLCVAVAFTAGNLMPVAEAMRERYPGRQFVFCADDDWQTKNHKGEPWNPGREKAENAAVVIGGRVVYPVFEGERAEKWTDFNDLHLAEGFDAVRRQVMAVARPAAEGEWMSSLRRTNQGALVAHALNVTLILENDERWAGVIGEDVFSGRSAKRRASPCAPGAGEWSDLDDTLTSLWMAEQYGLLVKSVTVMEAAAVVASRRQFHPVRDYLRGLEWDGIPRLSTWLKDYLGAQALAGRDEYLASAGMRWLVSAVARVMRPGCKADCVLILEGDQGLNKSSALGVLGGEWFMDTPIALGDKDAYQQLQGVWIAELAELDALNKVDSLKAKSFFGASVDTFRPSYGRRNIRLPRQCVFAGTTNQDEYLRDPTGNRRYWPVACTRVSLDALREARDQLWAEAYQLYQEGEPWWPQPSEKVWFEDEQDVRFASDAWETSIVRWLENNPCASVTSAELLEKALNLDPGHWGRPEQTRVGQIMHRLGWRRKRLAPSGRYGVRPYAYVRPDGWQPRGQMPLAQKEPVL